MEVNNIKFASGSERFSWYATSDYKKIVIHYCEREVELIEGLVHELTEITVASIIHDITGLEATRIRFPKVQHIPHILSTIAFYYSKVTFDLPHIERLFK
jgi:hypothetical protein